MRLSLRSKEELITLACDAANQCGLEPALVAAVCEQESGWNPWAIRYEPAFYQKYIVPLNLKSATEAQARAFSYGLLQCMGEVAREAGFKGVFLAELCDPEVNLEIGCKILKAKIDRAHGDVHQGLQFWNGGGNPDYADQVLARKVNYGNL